MEILKGDQSSEDEDPTSRVEKIFEQMDTDKDNKLTMAEFMEGSRNDPRIVQALSLQPDTSLTWTKEGNEWRNKFSVEPVLCEMIVHVHLKCSYSNIPLI